MVDDGVEFGFGFCIWWYVVFDVDYVVVVDGLLFIVVYVYNWRFNFYWKVFDKIC